MNEDIKNVVTNALEEVFEELKDNALDFVENTVFPYVDAAINDFEAAQTAEAEQSASGWVKIRAKLINTGINLVWSVTKKVVAKILEKAADDETAPTVQ
jgi:methionine salvage enolase-phosphatase E1